VKPASVHYNEPSYAVTCLNSSEPAGTPSRDPKT
jgi:hypothetical protein